MTVQAAHAAAARLSSAEVRLRAVRARMRRLEARAPVTADDVLRARAWAQAQQGDTALARERLETARRAAARRHRRVLDVLAAAGKTDRAEQIREAARQFQAARQVDTISEAEAVDESGAEFTADEDPIRALTSIRELRAANDRAAHLITALNLLVGGAGPEAKVQGLWNRLLDDSGKRNWVGWTHETCTLAAQRLPSVYGVAVTSQGGTSYDPVAASDPWTERVDELQRLVGEGPSLTACRTGARVMVDDLSTQADRWPGFVSASATSGVKSMWAIPLKIDGTTIAVATFYRHVSGPPSEADLTELTSLAVVAVAALIGDLSDRGSSVPDPAADHMIVHVATGIVAARLGVSTHEALSRLRARAFSSSRMLKSVAHDIVAGKLTVCGCADHLESCRQCTPSHDLG